MTLFRTSCCLIAWLFITTLLLSEAVLALGRRAAEVPAPTLGDAVVAATARPVVAASNDFGLELYRLLAAEIEGDNLFFSPYSIYSALSMAWEGSRGRAAREMREVLRIRIDGGNNDAAAAAELPQRQTWHNRVANLKAFLNDEDRPYDLVVASGLWGEQSFPFRAAYIETLDRYYESGLQEVDFINQPEAARREINSWIEERTNQRIKDLLPENSIHQYTRLVLANAIFFKAKWALHFDSNLTRDGRFTLRDGKVVEVPLMHNDDLPVRLRQSQGLTVLELPYQNHELAMVIVMPDDVPGLADLERELNWEKLEALTAGLESARIKLWMPRFTFESEFRLRDYLGAMGMAGAFLQDADFTGIADPPHGHELYLDDAFHKAFVEVDEEGTEAAAATAITIRVTALPPELREVRLDRPFLFFIREQETGVVLFFGRLLDPR